MADPTSTAIAAIHARINTEIAPDTLPYKIGRKHVRAHDAPPRVVWAEAKSPIHPTRRAGGNPAEIAIDAARFDVHIWHTSSENAWLALARIMAAARQLYAGPLLRFLGDTPMDDASTAMTPLGAGVVLQVEMRLAVFEFAAPTATIEHIGLEAIIELPGGDELLTVDQQNVYYVGKSGNDAWNGRSHDKAVLTIARAIALATAVVPAADNQFGIMVLDGGVYTESVAVPSWCHLFAPTAVLVSSITLAQNSSLDASEVAPPGGSTHGIIATTADVRYRVGRVVCLGATNGIACGGGAVVGHADYVEVVTGAAVWMSAAGGSFDASVGRANVTGAGIGLYQSSAPGALLTARVGELVGASGTGVRTANGALAAYIGSMACGTRWNCSGGTSELFVARLGAGGETAVVGLALTTAAQARAPVINIDETDSPYTGLEADEVIYYDAGASSVFNFPAGIVGKHYKLCNVGTFPITANGDGGELVFGAASQVVNRGEVMDAHYSATKGWY